MEQIKMPKYTYHYEMLDITGAETVEVDISKNGKVLWVNVNGQCALRICQIENKPIIYNKTKKE